MHAPANTTAAAFDREERRQWTELQERADERAGLRQTQLESNQGSENVQDLEVQEHLCVEHFGVCRLSLALQGKFCPFVKL